MMGVRNNRQVENVVVTVIFGLLGTAAVAGRFLSRRFQRVELLSSDWCMLLALAFALGAIISNLVAVIDGGLGLHQDTLSLKHVIIYGKAITALQLLWAAAEGAVKSSMCLLYMQLFPQRWFRTTACIILAVCNAFAVSVILGTVFICEPVSFSWDPTVDGSCGNRVGMWVAIGILNIVTDLLVVALPIPVVYNLSMKNSKKVGLTIIFTLGIFVCIVSGVRLKYLLAVDFAGDASYQIAEANIWSILEPTLAITFGCIPTLRPLLRKVRDMTTKKKGSYIVRSETRKRQDFTRIADNDLMLTSVSVAAPYMPNGPLSKVLQSNDSQSGSERGGHIEVTHQFEVKYEQKPGYEGTKLDG